jgi:ABC-type antimicrobial peptide transport system permease subunit
MSKIELVSKLPTPKRDTELHQVWRHLRRNRLAMAGLAVLALFLLCAILAPLLAPYDPLKTNFDIALQGPSEANILGTDWLGRDVFSRILFGTRISLIIGLISVTIGMLIGVPIGALSGYYGGKFDLIVQRMIDILIAFPGMLLAIVVVAVLGVGVENVMIAVGIASVPIYTRLVRGSVLAVKEQGYVAAAKSLGIGRHAHYPAPYYAQLPGADYCPVHISNCHSHFMGRRPWFLRTGRPAPRSGVGGHAQQRAGVHAHGTSPYNLSGPGHSVHGPWLQSPR